MAQMYFDPQTKSFATTLSEGAIPVPARVHRKIFDDVRDGKPVEMSADAVPLAVLGLTTLGGMRDAVLAELREQRAPILNALSGVWIDAHMVGDVQLQADVIAARTFLKNMPADPDVLAVTVEQGAEYMRTLILSKYRAYAAAAPIAVRNAFREVA